MGVLAFKRKGSRTKTPPPLCNWGMKAANRRRTRRVGNGQEAGGKTQDQDRGGAIERKRRRRGGGVEADRKDDSWHHERPHAEKRQHFSPGHHRSAVVIRDTERTADFQNASH